MAGSGKSQEVAVVRAWWCAVIVLMVGAVAACADDVTPDGSLEIVQYKAPAKWQATEKPGQSARVFTSPDSTSSQQAVLMVMLSPQQDRVDLGAAFDGIVKQMSQNGKVVQQSERTPGQTRQGFDVMSQTLVAEVAGGQRMWMRIVAANVKGRLATFCYLATTSDLYERHTPDVDAFLKSVSFTPGAAAAAGGGGEYAALEKERQELLARVAAIEARQRQLMASTSSGAVKGGVPVGVDDAALAKAKEEFAKTLESRRKPHVVLGTVLTLAGKPIPNVVACSVGVGGTTIAAERANYKIEVDANGHFEMQVPDGLYTVFPQCIVTVGWHQVQADLIAIDGRKEGVTQESAKGIVKDFRLVLNALRPEREPGKDDSYFGGVVKVMDPTYTPQAGQISHRHPNAKVRVTFVPLGPIIDGTTIEPFAVELPTAGLGGGQIARVPIGSYRVTAALVGADGASTPISCSTDINGRADFAEVFWERDRGSEFTRADPHVYFRD